MRRIYTITIPADNGKERVTTPFLESAEQAFIWIVRQRPFLWRQVQDIEIKPWHRGEKL